MGTDNAADRTVAAVEALGVDYEVMECDPAFADTAAFCEKYGVALEDSANAILVMGKSDPPVYALCVALATTKLDVNRTIRRKLGTKRASFAGADLALEITGMAIGGVTPFGKPDDLPLWVDAAVMERERVVVGGGGRDTKLFVAPDALLAIPNAEVVDGLALPIA